MSILEQAKGDVALGTLRPAWAPHLWGFLSPYTVQCIILALKSVSSILYLFSLQNLNTVTSQPPLADSDSVDLGWESQGTIFLQSSPGLETWQGDEGNGKPPISRSAHTTLLPTSSVSVFVGFVRWFQLSSEVSVVSTINKWEASSEHPRLLTFQAWASLSLQ